jgi:Cd2+/Zn2+-exporting ATPase
MQNMNVITKYWDVIGSAGLLALGFAVETWLAHEWAEWLTLGSYTISYLLVGGPVWLSAFKSIKKGVIFSEFFLMGIATVGAFILGEYVEGVAVMLFYMVGEHAQHGAVHKARNSIKKLIDQQPDIARVEQDGDWIEKHPKEVEIGSVIYVRPGEKIPLDGRLLTERAAFNTAALTGESKPVYRKSGEEVWAGSINQDIAVKMEVLQRYEDSKLSNILSMVEDASQRKAPTQRFMTKFARVYTPAVVWAAVAVTVLPYFFMSDYQFEEWFYKALILLVVSCPCGLVISIPLGYFGGIGAASQNGILLKGSDYLDQLRKMTHLFLDKTGTLTEGDFHVIEVTCSSNHSREDVLQLAASVEKHSTHPIAKAIVGSMNEEVSRKAEHVQELTGKGLSAEVDGRKVLVGSKKLMDDFDVPEAIHVESNPNTHVFVAVDQELIGTIILGDSIKPEAKEMVAALRDKGVKQLTVLSGDHPEIVQFVGKELGLDAAFGGLLPEDKFRKVEEALDKSKIVGFVGDGVNDAPVVTLADIGIAMGGIGSDATVETADVVIQNDQLLKIPLAIDIARFTHRIVWQNIVFALGIKAIVMVLAVFGLANMWGAIFADVGVALIAIANAIRIQFMFSSGKIGDAFLTASSVSNEKAECCEHC